MARKARDKFMCIYQILNKVNGKFYIGSTKDWYTRKSQHLQHLTRDKSPSKILQNSWNKYGESSFEFVVLEVVEIQDQLIEREQHYIDILKPEFNVRKIADRNSGISFKMPVESNIIRARKLMKPILQYDLNNNFIKEWDSAASVEKGLGISRSQICTNLKGNQRTCRGFIFKYKVNPVEYHGTKVKNKRKFPTDELLKSRKAEIKAKTYQVTFPCGKIEVVTNLKNFAVENNLKYGTLQMLLLYKDRVSKKGWKVIKHET